MMKTKIYTALITLAVLGMCFSCTDINHLHEPYLERGEQIYLGKIDSVHMYAGKNRIEAGLWFSDVRAKNLVVKYNGETDSICIPLEREPERPLRSDSILIKIPNVNEGTAMTFKFIIYDANMKYKSLPVESMCSAYGDNYQESILNRRLINHSYENGTLTIGWLRTGSIQILNTEIYYIQKNGEENMIKLLPNEVSCFIENVKAGSKVRYRSVFRPEASAIDLFYTEYNEFTIGE